MATAQALIVSVTTATTVEVTAISDIHFLTPGNNFPGIFVRSEQQELIDPQEIVLDEASVFCNKQVRWLYYNSQRWQRLYPIDPQTLSLIQEYDTSYDVLTITWWLFTDCSWSIIQSGTIVGQLTFTNAGQQTQLIAGIWPVYHTNNYAPFWHNSFQYVADIPIGYIYDTIGGVWFVGWSFGQHERLITDLSDSTPIVDLVSVDGDSYSIYGEELLMASSDTTEDEEEWVSIMLQGIVGNTTNITTTQSQDIQENTAWLFLQPTSFTAADIVNTLRRKSRQLCQWQTIATTILPSSTVVCAIYESYNPSQTLTIDVATNQHANKTIIVKNANVELIGAMTASSDPLHIFIDNGNIIRDTNETDLVAIDTYWESITEDAVTQWILLKGNILLDGLMLPASWESFRHKTYLHGKLLSLHSPTDPSTEKITHITRKFGPGYEWFIWLDTVFGWRCDSDTNIWTDGSDCESAIDPYASAPFILIDKQYHSTLLQ